MTIDRLSSSAIGQAAASTPAGAGSAPRAVAVAVLGSIGAQFLQAAGQGPVGKGVAYPLGQWAEALATPLGATPLETLELESALGAFAGALAADMAALADGRTLDRLDAALAAVGEPPLPAGPSELARHFEDLASHVAQAR